MKLGIIGAMQEEVEILLKEFGQCQKESFARHEFYLGKYAGHDIVLCRSGIGKVSAGSTATILAEHYGVQAVVNSGIAGGIGKGLKIADTVISTGTAYHDFDLSVFGYEKGQIPEHDRVFAAGDKLLETARRASESVKSFTSVHEGLIVSGDQFISSDEAIARILSLYPQAVATEMEGAAIGHICNDYNIPYLVIRAISDSADDDAPDSSVDFMPVALKSCSTLVLEIIKLL